MLGKLAEGLAAIPDWNHDACDRVLRELAAAEGVKAGLLINATRVAIVGQAVAPPLFETMVCWGRSASSAECGAPWKRRRALMRLHMKCCLHKGTNPRG